MVGGVRRYSATRRTSSLGDRGRLGGAVRWSEAGREACHLEWQDHKIRKIDVGFFPAASSALSVGYAFRLLSLFRVNMT
ncbi:hypothetical protein DV26_40875 [Amycolatopsis mediterranei]|nr:hypothetical protein DV26_40875 [Amycolatopsis mediterranei]KDU90231.1 hypothetical protein DV36_21290 [Amycolatopsis mediterranei]